MLNSNCIVKAVLLGCINSLLTMPKMSLRVLAEVEVELAALTMCLFACNKLEHVSAVKSPTDWLWTWRQPARLSVYTQVLSNYTLNYRTKKTLLFTFEIMWHQNAIKKVASFKYLFKHSNKQTHVHVNALTHATSGVRRKKLSGLSWLVCEPFAHI